MLAETADTVQWRRCQIALMKRRPCEIDFLLPCEECGEDVVCLNNTLLHCPEHSTAPAGSSHSEDCVCEGGYFNEVLFFA